MEELEKKVELSLLYDFYGGLLSEHKKQIFEDYFLNDLSLSEIAENACITRQGVHDSIKNTEKTLLKYEETLKLLEKYKFTKKRCEEIKGILKDNSDEKSKHISELIEEIETNGI